jgi:hypothetical protein
LQVGQHLLVDHVVVAGRDVLGVDRNKRFEDDLGRQRDMARKVADDQTP